MAVKMVAKKITPVPTYTAGKAPTGYAPGGIATTVKKTTVPKLGPLPGYTQAINAFKPSAATIAAIAPTQAAKNALGPAWGGAYSAGNQPIPDYLMPAQPTPPPTPPGTVGRKTPFSAVPTNYTATLDEIYGNPLYTSALGSFTADQQSAFNALRSAIGQKVIGAGYDPSAAFQKLLAERPDLGQLGFNADFLRPADLATAATNPLSERAQQDIAYNRGASNLDYSLAARGLSGSGAVATGRNQLEQTRQTAQYNTLQELLGAIQGGIGGYLTNRQTAYGKLQDVAGQVAQMLAQQPGAAYPEEDTSLTQYEEGPASNPVNQVPETTVPSAKTPAPNYFMWGGQKVYTPQQMTAILGGPKAYKAWAQKHGDAARMIENAR